MVSQKLRSVCQYFALSSAMVVLGVCVARGTTMGGLSKSSLQPVVTATSSNMHR